MPCCGPTAVILAQRAKVAQATTATSEGRRRVPDPLMTAYLGWNVAEIVTDPSRSCQPRAGREDLNLRFLGPEPSARAGHSPPLCWTPKFTDPDGESARVALPPPSPSERWPHPALHVARGG